MKTEREENATQSGQNEQMDLSERVKKLRLKKNWSQRELADRMGEKQPTIWRLESGTIEWTEDYMRKAANAFGLTVAKLFGQVESQGSDEIAIISTISRGLLKELREMAKDEMRFNDDREPDVENLAASLLDRAVRAWRQEKQRR